MGRLSALEFPAADSTPKKDRLTLTQLAAYDDILTDALVDHVFARCALVMALLY